MKYKFLFLIIILNIFHNLSVKADKVVEAIKIPEKLIKIDGFLNEIEWKSAVPISDFIQLDPVEGADPTEKVEVRILYDYDFIYFGAKMYRQYPDSILSSVTKRDEVGNSERIIFSLDTYRDRRTAYTFGINANGSRFDYYHSKDNEYSRDFSYNPVWEGDAKILSDSWTAEIRIPFSQLRFNNIEEQIWGLNINQWTPHKREDIYWVHIPKGTPGWSSHFGSIKGIKQIKSSNRIELMPYIAGTANFDPQVDSKNPFRSPEEYGIQTGMDLKMGVGPNFTIDAAINPDFGQVEADPAVVNLTAYETFYEEKRPFFIEGNQLLKGNGANFYYSRRIGSRPSGSAEGDYVESVDNTPIIGAAKITGRNNDGLSIGALSALTKRTFAEFTDNGEFGSTEIEPLTTYNLFRIQQEFGDHSSTIGAMATGVKRFFSNGSDLNEQMNSEAYSGGMDWNYRFDDLNYEFSGFWGVSHVIADSKALLNLQQTSAHYFQRPDADHVSLDSNLTSLSGYSCGITFAKVGGENWLWGSEVYLESPGFEINDMGRLVSADDIKSILSLEYREVKSTDIFHSYSFEFSMDNEWNFAGDHTNLDLQLIIKASTLVRDNYYLFAELEEPVISDDWTRGGPLMTIPKGFLCFVGYNSSWAENTTWGFESGLITSEIGKEYYFIEGVFSHRTGGRFDFSIKPKIFWRTDPIQYIGTYSRDSDETYGKRYVFAHIKQNTISAQFRFNYSFTSDISLELYLEPFAASADFSQFGELSKSKTHDILRYGYEGTIITEENNTYKISGKGNEFSIDDPDFNSLSFRSNLVFRWEWLPGSTLYFVWQQIRSDYFLSPNPVDHRSIFDSITSDGINYFAVKASYWFSA